MQEQKQASYTLVLHVNKKCNESPGVGSNYGMSKNLIVWRMLLLAVRFSKQLNAFFFEAVWVDLTWEPTDHLAALE